MRTLTDRKDFECVIIEKDRYNALSQKQKEYFELLRNAILEIFPVSMENSNRYDTNTVAFAERYAFIYMMFVDKFEALLKENIDRELDKIRDIVVKLQQAGTLTGGTGVGTTSTITK